MVQSVVAVPSIGKVKREHRNNSHSGSGEKNSGGSFAQILAEAKEENQRAPMDCCTTTYGRDRQIQTFIYRSGEYHF